MHGYIRRVFAAAASILAVSAAGVSGASASTAAPQAARVSSGVPQALASPGAQLWVKRYGSEGTAYSVAASPTGKEVFVTGASGTSGYATVAYNAATGAQLWVKHYNDGRGSSVARSVAVSPDGKTVFVTGSSNASSNVRDDYATVAYNATTGAQLWAKRYNGPANYENEATSVAVSPTGTLVFVTGSVSNAQAGYATVAYNAATGAQVWVKRYVAHPGSLSTASSVTVSPDGGTVFVTGGSSWPGVSVYATVAYNATTGAQLWAKHHNGFNAAATSMAVSPNGRMVYVTGKSFSSTTNYNYVTVAYNATTGAQVWVKRYIGPGKGGDDAYSVAVSPTGGTVFVTGQSYGNSTTSVDYATVAYNATTGAQMWVNRYNGPANGADYAYSVAVSPTGRTVYVTGQSGGATSSTDYATVAYNATTGAQMWVNRYGGANNINTAYSIAVSPTGTVFVTGTAALSYATVAYQG